MNFTSASVPYVWVWWTAAFLYHPAVVGLQKIAPALKPWQSLIRQAWGVWNISFSLLSVTLHGSTLRVYVAMIRAFCDLGMADRPGAVAFWDQRFTGPVYHCALWFLVSKLVEPVDTLFLAAMGKPIRLLHWYHRLMLLMCCYIGGIKWHPHMISAVTWHCCVHAVMYAYCASSCYGNNGPNWLARLMTAVQITQVAAQLALLLAACLHCGWSCHLSYWPSLAMSAICTCLWFINIFRRDGSQEPPVGSKEDMRKPTVPEKWQSYVTINGYNYDITEFANKHPGGNVIRQYAGFDATAAFTEFHSASSKASSMLQALPRRASLSSAGQGDQDNIDCVPATHKDTRTNLTKVALGAQHVSSIDSEPASADDTHMFHVHPSGQQTPARIAATSGFGSKGLTDADIMADFAVWRDELVAKGMFKPRTTWQLAAYLSEPLIYVAVACWVMHSTGSTLLGALLISVASVRCGWIQHEGGHNSLTGNSKVDKLIQTMYLGLGLYTSGCIWNLNHNKHHATPNKVNNDIDIRTLPLVAWYKGAVEKDSRPHLVSRTWLRTQAYTFLPVSCFFVAMLWAAVVHPIKAWKKDKLGLAVMAVAHVARPALFVTFGGTTILQGFLLDVLTVWILSMWLFGHFALSHSFMPVVDEDKHTTWVRFAMEHSVDISTGNRVVDWVMGYLNYQVIHHLFPSMPQCNGNIVSQELRIKAKQWGIKYTTMSYFAAWKAALSNLDAVGAHYYAELQDAGVAKKVA